MEDSNNKVTDEFRNLSAQFKEVQTEFSKNILKLGKNGLNRVLNAMVLHPIEEYKPLTTQIEADLVKQGIRAIEIKYLMMTEVEKINESNITEEEVKND